MKKIDEPMAIIVAAIIGLTGVFIAGYFVIRAAQEPFKQALHATQTVEARLTVGASEKAPTGTPSPEPTITATPTDTPEPILTNIPKPYSTPPPQPTIVITRVREADDAIMVYVPAGEFTMGSNEGTADQQPAHVVNLEAFWIDMFEVTNRQYRKCVEENHCWASTFEDDSNYNADEQPVVGVNWDKGAYAYCEWVSSRLPTEAEWEKAARGTDGRLYPWGGDEFDAYRVNSKLDKGPDIFTDGAAPVGSFPDGASPYGALDMSGNVWEWTNSLYMDYPYYNNQDERENTESAGNRVVRGGSWDSGIEDKESGIEGLTTTWRSNYTRGTRFKDTGFRCADSASE